MSYSNNGPVVFQMDSSRPSTSSSSSSSSGPSVIRTTYRDATADGRKVDVAERKDRNGNVVVVYNHHKPNPARDEPRASDF